MKPLADMPSRLGGGEQQDKRNIEPTLSFGKADQG